MIANRKRLKIDFKLRKILPRNKIILENCTNIYFPHKKYVDCNNEGTKNYTVPNLRESFFAEWHKIQKIYEMRIQSNEHKKEFANFCKQYTKCDCQKFEFDIDYIFYFCIEKNMNVS